MSLADCIKKAMDCALVIPYTLGLRPYQVFAVQIQHTGTRPGLGTRSRVDTEILVGDGYPPVSQVSAKDVFSSGGLLNDKDFKLTVITEYDTGVYTGGTLRDTVDPQPEDGNNTQIYFLMYGGGLPPTGQYFKKIWGKEDGNLTNDIYLRATGEIPGA